jgi:2'-5' RNA ligase
VTAVVATDRLFFALIPDDKTIEAICGTRRHLCDMTGVSGAEVLPEHLNVPLLQVGDGSECPPEEIIETLMRRAGGIDLPSCTISFTRAKSLGEAGVVLCGGRTAAPVRALSSGLDRVLAGPGPRKRRRFVPHMTLLRSRVAVAPRDVAPVTWTAREIVLVHRLPDSMVHRHVGRLPLRPGAQLWLPGFDF